jgi:hypothetical protein
MNAHEIESNKPLFEQFPVLKGLERFDGYTMPFTVAIGGSARTFALKTFEYGTYEYNTVPGYGVLVGAYENKPDGGLIPAGFIDLTMDDEHRLARCTTSNFIYPYIRGESDNSEFLDDIKHFRDCGGEFYGLYVLPEYRNGVFAQTMLPFTLAALEQRGYDKMKAASDGTASLYINAPSYPPRYQSSPDDPNRLEEQEWLSFYTRYAVDSTVGFESGSLTTTLSAHLSQMQVSLIEDALNTYTSIT